MLGGIWNTVPRAPWSIYWADIDIDLNTDQLNLRNFNSTNINYVDSKSSLRILVGICTIVT